MDAEAKPSVPKRVPPGGPRGRWCPGPVHYDTDARADPVRLPLLATRRCLGGTGGCPESVLQALGRREDEARDPTGRRAREQRGVKNQRKKKICHSLYTTPDSPREASPTRISPGGPCVGSEAKGSTASPRRFPGSAGCVAYRSLLNFFHR